MNDKKPSPSACAGSTLEIERISEDESEFTLATPAWIIEENKRPSDECLRQIILVGAPPED
jgi:hypothetical protein